MNIKTDRTFFVSKRKSERESERRQMDELFENEAEKSTMVAFHADDVIIREGCVYSEMYKILSGSVAVYMKYGERDEYLIGIYSKSRCFGEMNVLSEQPSIYTVVAYDDVLLMRIEKESLEEFIRNHPRNAIDIMQNMVHTFIVMQKNIDLLLNDIYEKQDTNKKRTAQLREKIMQYSMNGLNIGMMTGLEV